MARVAPAGFVIVGGIALIEAGVSTRPTEDLDAFSSTCDDVAGVLDRLVASLEADGYLVDVHLRYPSFARFTVSSGAYRRTALRVELARDTQLWPTVAGALGPMLSTRELAANKVLAAFARHEPRDLVDLAALAQVAPVADAIRDARAKDTGFDPAVFAEMVTRTAQQRDDLWPVGSSPAAVREFVRTVLLHPDTLTAG